jgi:hypothetical protein
MYTNEIGESKSGPTQIWSVAKIIHLGKDIPLEI